MLLKLGVGVPDHLTVMHYNSVFTDTRLRTERRENRDSNPVKSMVLFLPLYHPGDFVPFAAPYSLDKQQKDFFFYLIPSLRTRGSMPPFSHIS